MKKFLSTVLTMVMLLAVVVPCTYAEDTNTEATYTVQYLDDCFIRITDNNTSFSKSETRIYSINIPADGEYAVFFKNGATNTNHGVAVTLSQGIQIKTIGSADEDVSAYKFGYCRMGAATATNDSNAVSLKKGETTLTFKVCSAMTVSYIDIRRTDAVVTAAKTAIYPSDYTTYSKVKNNGHVNKYISVVTTGTGKAEMLKNGYDYWGTYTDEEYDRALHIAAGENVTYRVNIQNPGYYYVSALAQHFYDGTVKEDIAGAVTFSLDNESFYTHNDTVTTSKNPQDNEVLTSDRIYIPAGKHTLTVETSGFGTFLKHLLLEDDNVSIAAEPVRNYVSSARALYETDAYADYTNSIIGQYATNNNALYDRPVAVELAWEAITGADSYTLTLATTEDFSENVKTYTDITGTSYKQIYNLLSGTTYYWKVTGDNGQESGISSFATRAEPRFIRVPSLRNVRDLGGWNGLKQGMVYRGPELVKVQEYTTEINDTGRAVMRDELHIKTDLDFRAIGTDNGSITVSPLEGVTLVQKPIGNYMAIYDQNQKDAFAEVLKTFANPENYPIYMHCAGGADRTGTVAFLLAGLCGASETDLSIDFELTSFARFGARTRVDDEEKGYKYASMLKKMKEYEGETLQDKFETYAKTELGLTETEIATIQYMLMPDAAPVNALTVIDDTVTATAVFDENVTGTAILALYNGAELVSVETVDVANVNHITIKTKAYSDITSAKVMVWSDFNTLVPKTKATEFKVN